MVLGSKLGAIDFGNLESIQLPGLDGGLNRKLYNGGNR